MAYVSGAESRRDGRGFVAADFDRDGDLDLFLVNNNQPAVYLENRAAAGRHWSVIQLRSRFGNSHGIGARVTLVAGGKTQVREIHAGSGYLSSPAPEAHFGLGRAQTIERLEIRWPSGQRQLLKQLTPNRIIVVKEPDSRTMKTSEEKK